MIKNLRIALTSGMAVFVLFSFVRCDSTTTPAAATATPSPSPSATVSSTADTTSDTIAVTTPNDAFAFTFSSANLGSLGTNPNLTLKRGQTYTFNVNTANEHPFVISSDTNATAYSDGVTGANNVSSGTITFTVPVDAPATLYYRCSIHKFGGTFTITD